MAREYKDSGIEWIGEIPVEWNVTEIKRIMRNKSVRNQPDAMVLSLYRDYGIIPKDSRDDNFNVTSDDTTNYKVVGIGDFVINKMKAWQGSMAVSEFDGIISPAYYVCSFTDKNISRKYIHYLLRNESYKPEYMRLSTGLRIGQWDLGIDDFMKIPIVLPSLDEQQRIADLLDEKCGEIDKLVSLQEQMIEELKAYKKSVITEAVTKGLNPDAPMKDSGIDWIGDVPKGWKISRIKNIFRLRTGTTPKAFEQGLDSDALVNWFTPSDVTEMNCELKVSERHLSKEIIDKEGIELSPAGSLIFVGIGASAGKIGYAMVEGYSNQQITTLIPIQNKCFGKFSYYYMIADRKRIKDNAFYTTLPIINNSYLSEIKTLLPPIDEQRSIALYLDTKCAEIDSLINIKRQKIESLKEYKKSIIFEYVTGKKQVV